MIGSKYPIRTIFTHINGVTWVKEGPRRFRFISEGYGAPEARDTYDYDHYDWSTGEWKITPPKEELFDKLYLKLKSQ